MIALHPSFFADGLQNNWRMKMIAMAPGAT
jgi:hypothetical protein